MYSNVFLLGKKIRIYVFGKKDRWHMKSTSCYLVPSISFLTNSVCLMIVTWMPTEFMI